MLFTVKIIVSAKRIVVLEDNLFEYVFLDRNVIYVLRYILHKSAIKKLLYNIVIKYWSEMTIL